VTGLFITVEGPDGAGKSSLVKGLVPLIQSALSIPLVVTREPGGSDIAEEIREILLNPEHTAMDDRTEALLLAAGRRQHVVEKIIPALERNEVVLCDRFVDSSIAYQGHARGIGMEEVAAINQFATEGLTPDLTLYLDVDAEVGLNRIADKNSNRTHDRLELEEVTFHEKVREAYHQLVKENSERFVTVDASQSQEAVLQDCWHIVEKRLKLENLV
jgi:dTMP kinase